MYKVLALDLDGTVLNSKHEINPELKEAIQKIKRHYHVMLVTGRHHTSAKPYHDELGLDTPIICCNGTYIYDFAKNEVLFANAIEKESAFKFLDLSDQYNINSVIYVTNEMVHLKSKPIDFLSYLEGWALNYPENDRPQVIRVDSLRDNIEPAEYVWKFVAEGDIEAINQFSELDFIKENFNGERSWVNRVDFAKKGNTKGVRLQQYLDMISVSAAEVVAIGDNHNDISMIELAGMGIAMNNADDKVKSKADRICTTNSNGNGISLLLDELFLVS
ncbi:Cof-type HAD-IIB family hydrolase [Vibrio sp. SS-MA-C1-2]|uniref:Cof-type HAD-IIB family hydrolase n=1 Tax=Vibrio sp. SS-MA-C1-2 TaxID=2908646 RepID=UPI001F364559|nr:Cof-type HAD-IIB family hydrolase [Vibrio sp. SS-MA-C1-2]UJF19052.1 Cof-type HAD-IIB family hydrolase [Vibrio sp. SS-MA-C1-2]